MKTDPDAGLPAAQISDTKSNMDPASIIAGAVTTGAAAALKDTATQAVKDAYGGLVRLIRDAYEAHSHVAESVEHLAKWPQDENLRTGLERDLREAVAEIRTEEQLVAAAIILLKEVESHDTAAARAVGVDIGILSSSNLKFKRVQTPVHGTAVRIREANVKGTTSFEDIGGALPPKK